jgi:hypothetical protein
MANAEEARIDCRVLYEIVDGVYVDAGRAAGLRQGAKGRLERGGQRVAEVEVVKSGGESTYLRIVALHGAKPSPGETLGLVFEGAPAASAGSPAGTPSQTLKGEEGDEAPFVPLLAPPDLGARASTEPNNVFHGWVSFYQLGQLTGGGDHNAYISRLRTGGTLERIDGTPWNFEWSAEVSYRDGEALEDRRDFQEVRFDTYRLSVYRRFDDHSFVRFGRFIPVELPSVGYLDGVQGEKVIDEHVRLGGMLGFKPGRFDLNMSLDEPMFVPYVTFETGLPPEAHYSGTFGVLGSLWNGSPDRLALLGEQTFDIGNFSALASSELDVDVGGAVERDGVRLTRLNLVGTYVLGPAHLLRAGIDHYELPDNEGEQDAIDIGTLNIEEFFEDSWWRYWVGASHQFGWGLRLSEEVGYLQSDVDDGIRWVVTLTRTGLPSFPDGSINLSLYNIDGVGADGYGGRLSAYFPFRNHRLLLMPAVAFRYVEHETTGSNFFDSVTENLWIADVSVRAQYVLSKAWSLQGGVAYAYGDEEDRFLIDVAVTFRW